MFIHAMEKLKKGKGCKFIMMEDITEQVVHEQNLKEKRE